MAEPQKIRLELRVQPNAKKEGFEQLENGRWKLKISAKPIDGEANEAVIEFLARHYRVSKSSVKILSGLRSKNKIVEILPRP